MDAMWGLLLVVLGGFLAGGTIALWRTSRPMAAVVGLCAVIAVVAGALRMDYFA